jgi:hypothetical protein
MTFIGNEKELQFSSLLSQIEQSLRLNLYFVAIMTSLVIPDIGGAIDSENGKTDKFKYINWFDKYVKTRYTNSRPLTGRECYYLRCSMLHQGITKHSNQSGNITFMNYPQSNSSVNPISLDNHLGLIIEPKTFCNNIIFGAYDWLDTVHNHILFNKNMENFITLYSIVFSNI